MDVVVAFLVGVAGSAVVSYVVYRRQRRESLQAEGTLLAKLAQHGDVLNLNTSTTLQVAGATGRLERDVAVLREQLSRAVDSGETLRLADIRYAAHVLPGDGSLDLRSLKQLHRVLLGRDLEYAGEFRDVPVVVGGHGLTPPLGVAVVQPEEIHPRLEQLLADWNRWATEAGDRSPDQWLKRISALHAELVAVHPFFDGNGLVARVLLAVQTERFWIAPVVLPRNDRDYFSSLRLAVEGDTASLVNYLKNHCSHARGR
jgi:fido (protein-threonine AMPylation protein)